MSKFYSLGGGDTDNDTIFIPPDPFSHPQISWEAPVEKKAECIQKGKNNQVGRGGGVGAMAMAGRGGGVL